MTDEQPDRRILEVVEESFGHSALLPGQEEALTALVRGKDVLLISPTGSGKSLSYQAAGVLIPGVTLVVSPLLALQEDQIEGLAEDHRSELQAARISSAETVAQREAVLDRAAAGELEFVFLAPEQLANDKVHRRLAEIGPSLVAVDEAHCVSSWGHDFRPDYFRLGELLEGLADGHGRERPRVVVMTATAALPVREDIVERLRMVDPEVVVTGFERPNLALEVRRVTTAEEQRRLVLELVEQRPLDDGGSAIVYCRTRKVAEQYADAIGALGRSTAVYHAGLSQKKRSAAYDAFMDGDVEIMVATSAFGMGIDKPDIRWVLHTQIPESPDTYYQEVGRAGRDGEPAEGILVFREEDLALGRFFSGGIPKRKDVEAVLDATTSLETPVDPEAVQDRTGLGPRRVGRILNLVELVVGPDAAPTRAAGATPDAVLQRAEAHQKLERSRVEMMRAYAETDRCRADFLLGYFGEEITRRCGVCDNCRSGAAEESRVVAVDAPFPVQTVVRHEEFGEGTVTDVEEDRLTVLFEDVGYRTLSARLVTENELLTKV